MSSQFTNKNIVQQLRKFSISEFANFVGGISSEQKLSIDLGSSRPGEQLNSGIENKSLSPEIERDIKSFLFGGSLGGYFIKDMIRELDGVGS